MCCLFGILDHHASLSVQQRTKLLSVLATQSEVRGRDATGIAYNSGGQLRIFKRAKAAHELRFHLPHDATCLMGHTRMATQGDEKMNYNNHPFPGVVGGTSFALAHNGVIHNDHTLRSEQGLPQTVVETDSYIAVQLLEREGAVDCSSLARVAELLQGTVALSVLDGENNCYLVKGNNPLCVYHWRKAGLFVYASTEQILLETFRIFTVPFGQPETVKLVDGEILKIDPIGRYSKSSFDTKNLSVVSHTYHMTLGNWLDLCLEVYMNNNLKQSTYNSYESYIRVHFKPALGDVQLRDLNPRLLQQFYNYKMEEEKLAPKTVINLNLFLHKALSHAMAEGLIQSNPAEAVSLSRGQKPQIDVLKREEQAALIRGSYQFRYGVFVRLVLFTGLRLGELLGLRWEDIDFTHNMLYVKRALNRLNKKKRPTDPNETTTEIVIQTPKSENSVRSIPLLPNLANELWQWKAVQARDRAQMGDAYVESGMIVTAPDGRYIEPRTFSDYYHQILQGCGLQHFTFHALRHTFATRALEQGMDSKTLSVLLGHYSVSFTLDTYAHVLDSQKIDSMGLMADLLNLPDTEIQPNAYSIIVSPKSDGSFYFSAPDFPSVTHVGIDYISGIQCMKDKLSEEILMSLIIPLPMPIEQIPMQAGDILVQVLI